MPERRFRKPNALKHGAFSGTELLPWEDKNAYEELRRGLREQYEPEGPLQEDCVDTILSALWRKRRVRDKRNFDIAAALDRIENRVLWQDPPPFFDTSEDLIMHQLRERKAAPSTTPRDDYEQLLGFSTSLYGSLDGQFVELRLGMLPKEFSAHLRDKVPRKKFESASHWVCALKKEVDGVLLPMVRARAPQGNAYFESAGAFLGPDRILQDLEVEGRLDAVIDRAMKRLYQDKAAREFCRPKQPKLIETRKPAQLESPSATNGEVEE